jgi:hypothetical protein
MLLLLLSVAGECLAMNSFRRLFTTLLCGVFLSVAVSSVSAVAQQTYVEQLRKESRLPEWANYVCYEDAKNLVSGWFMLVAYKPASDDDLFTSSGDAERFGYERGLTYQEYLSSDTGISPMNMPISPEEYASELKNMLETGKASPKAISLLAAQTVAAQNAVAIAKITRQRAATHPAAEKQLLEDEELQALLDCPDGTKCHNFIDKHPGFISHLFDMGKYHNGGITPKDGFNTYREGNVIYENLFGADIFETPGTGDKATDDKSLSARIQMQDTASGLRFLKSHAFGGSAIGIPVSGRCDLISAPTHVQGANKK